MSTIRVFFTMAGSQGDSEAEAIEAATRVGLVAKAGVWPNDDTPIRVVKSDARPTPDHPCADWFVRVLFEGPREAFHPGVRSDRIGRDDDWK
jgi:hypothetical protein